MIFKDYYRILGLETTKVTSDAIKTAYREQAKKYHPDVNVGSKVAEDRFKDINEAYRVLSNSSSKRKYDRMWNSHIGRNKKVKYEETKKSTGSLFSDFFYMFFGNLKDENLVDDKNKSKGKQPLRGEDIETEITITLEEAFYGASKKIALRTVDGNLKSFNIKVPAGIQNGEKVRLLGQGKSGINGGKNGDLLIKIKIEENKKFKLKGYDLYTDLLLTPWEAALGTKVKIDGIDEQSSLYIPKGIQSGEQIKIQEKGYKDQKGGRGNLIANIKVMVPDNLSVEEKELFEKLNSISKFNPRSGSR